MAPGSFPDPSITYQILGPLSSIDGFSIWYYVHFLLRVGSFSCVIFIPLHLLFRSFFLFFLLCVWLCSLSLLPSLFVKQIYSFVFLRFFYLRPLSFASLPSFGNVVRENIISLGGSSVTTVRSFFRLAILFLPSLSAPCFQKTSPSYLVDNSSPYRTHSISKISITYVLYTTAIRHHQSQKKPRLDLSSLSRLRFTIINKGCVLW